MPDTIKLEAGLLARAMQLCGVGVSVEALLGLVHAGGGDGLLCLGLVCGSGGGGSWSDDDDEGGVQKEN